MEVSAQPLANAKMTYLITGGAGFIGTNFVLNCRRHWGIRVINLDKLTYAGNLHNLAALTGDPNHHFVHGDIGDTALVHNLLHTHHPAAVINFAAESHVDRSIASPDAFIHTNVVGTFNLLSEVLGYWTGLAPGEKEKFRFLQISTDEVYGSLTPNEPPFRETTAYAPNSPYSASKAAADHLVRAYHHTYGLPTLTTNCSNNYGPYQFPEKLIPLVIHNALHGHPIPVYGDGANVRDWLYVEDHCRAIQAVLEKGESGQVYNIGGNTEMPNIAVVRTICATLDEAAPSPRSLPYASQIHFVTDRPGHDRRYAIDASKIKRDLGWVPRDNFSSGIARTVRWYLDHADWVANVTSGAYRQWIKTNYEERS